MSVEFTGIDNDEFLVAGERPISGDLKISTRCGEVCGSNALYGPWTDCPWTVVCGLLIITRFFQQNILFLLMEIIPFSGRESKH
jgi:hypothetical protein